jgi:glycosyltransferase involved in cell wall biosynthesis
MIGQVINAAKAAVSEIVIIDSGSTDATLDIAEKSGARIVKQPWLGNGKQKRAAEDAATYNWVLDLDADEIVSPELAGQIRDLFAAGEPAHPVYQLDMVTVPPIGEPWYSVAVADRKKLYDKRVVRAPDHAAWDQFEVPPLISRFRALHGKAQSNFDCARARKQVEAALDRRAAHLACAAILLHETFHRP